MPLEYIDRDQIRTYSDGRIHFFVGLCEKVGLPSFSISVMEQVVRKGLKEENETVVATGKKINAQPTQLMILRIFYNIVIQTYIREGKVIRYLFKPLNESQAKIIRYLGMAESTFAWNST